VKEDIMKINPYIGVAAGVIFLAIGLAVGLITLDVAGAVIALLSASRVMRDRRNQGSGS
jgi:hypothetical protein